MTNPNHIVGIIKDRQGRTVVAADNGVFELRESMEGDSFVLLAASEADRVADEYAEHERQVNASVRNAVDASRRREQEENGRGVTTNDPQSGVDQEGREEKLAVEGDSESVQGSALLESDR